ncbi:MAG: glutathione S-transferase family protein, partial [Mesorhizobium sp.]
PKATAKAAPKATAKAAPKAKAKPAKKLGIKLSMLRPSVNNMTVRVFARAAGLDPAETDAWGLTRTPEFL